VEGITTDFDHTQGRPSKGEQLKIERTLRPYFENSIDLILKLLQNTIMSGKRRLPNQKTQSFSKNVKKKSNVVC